MDRLDVPAGIALAETLLGWCRTDRRAAVGGDIGLAPSGTTFETFYFDGPSTGDWPALALLPDGTATFGFKNALAYAPADSERWELPTWPTA